jgi:hypothetical protein
MFSNEITNYPFQFWGPQSVFFKLSNGCFSKRADKYEYNFCPFQKAEQRDGAAVTVIGRASEWIFKDSVHGYKLRMIGGDSRGCPDHGSRETIVS